jgi:hypothetical protein
LAVSISSDERSTLQRIAKAKKSYNHDSDFSVIGKPLLSKGSSLMPGMGILRSREAPFQPHFLLGVAFGPAFSPFHRKISRTRLEPFLKLNPLKI